MRGWTTCKPLPLDSAATVVYNKGSKREGRRIALKNKKRKSKLGYRVAAGVMDVFGAAAASHKRPSKQPGRDVNAG